MSLLADATRIGQPVSMSTVGERLPHGYRNLTRRVEGRAVVEKTYVGSDAKLRLNREELCLRALVDVLPVPPVLDKDEARCALRLGFVRGRPGPDLVEKGLASQALRATGAFLARFQSGASAILTPLLEGSGTVAVHGDYGLHNLLFDACSVQIVALVDWELAHVGDMVEDLAWAEWIVRMHYSTAIEQLDALFGGYGAHPRWSERHASMIERCESLVQLCEREQQLDTLLIWRTRLRTTEGWTE